LDWLAARFPKPNLIKIDVEEAETKVLAKATDVLHAHPKIICEVAGGNSTNVADILINCGYTLYDADQPAHMRIPIPFAAPNTLGIRLPN
jgi:hypothetical protein